MTTQQIDINTGMPIDLIQINTRKQTTIQTHNNVAVATNNSPTLNANWIDCSGYDQVAFTAFCHGVPTWSGDVYWSNDGTNTHATELSVIPSSANTYKAASIPIKARYMKLALRQTDASVTHNCSAWAYLKA